VDLLLIDDDAELCGLLTEFLSAQGFGVECAQTGPAGLERALEKPHDLVILDVMLPGMDGFDVLQKIREFSSVPVIMLTAKDQDVDVVKGLQSGADDYVKKPFSVHELMARVEAVLRRAAPGDDVQTRPPFVVDDFTMDFSQRKITVRGKEIRVGPTEFKLLSQLVRNAGRVMLHADLLRKVWGPEYGGETEYLRVYISYLRNKIELDPAKPKYILTEHGVGYLFKRPE
jgi:DNA-binding response OmpR family regulator